MRDLIRLAGCPFALLRGCLLLIVWIIVLIVLGSCLALGWELGRVSADTLSEPGATPTATPTAPVAPPTALDVGLIIDQSDSLWMMGGVGSDPQQLRMAAARMFAARLAVEPQWQARLGLVYFGTEAKLVLPLSSIDQPDTQQKINALTATKMGWTDIIAAVETAERELLASERTDPAHRKVLVIFTDGRPDTPQLGPPDALGAYLSDLEARITRLTQRGVLVFTVLLNNSATAGDPLLQRVYRPFWVQLAERGGSVRFYDVASPEDLVQTYADIAMLLGTGASRGVVVNETVGPQGRATVQVAPGWRRAAFLVTRSRLEMQVTINRPNGRALVDSEPGIGHRVSDRDGFDVWTVETPTPGEWVVETRGEGIVTVRLDYEALPPTVTPAFMVTRTITPSPPPTDTPSPTATATVAVVAALPAQPTPLPELPDPPGQGGRWLWLLLPAALLIAGSGLYLRRRSSRRPPAVQGALRQMSATAESGGGQTWNLTSFGRAALTVGDISGSDIRLTTNGTTGTGFRIERRAGQRADGETWLVVQSSGVPVRVNGTLVAKERRLSGWDTIAIGAWQGRYENLSERAEAERATRAGAKRSHR